MASAISRENSTRSTASACPAGTAVSSAIRNSAEPRTPHLLLQQPRRRIRRLALQRVGANQLAKIDRLVRRRQARLSVHHGAHLVQIDLAAQPRRSQRGLRPCQALRQSRESSLLFPAAVPGTCFDLMPSASRRKRFATHAAHFATCPGTRPPSRR